jgi:hypothetical protein
MQRLLNLLLPCPSTFGLSPRAPPIITEFRKYVFIIAINFSCTGGVDKK